nr:MAG TPA: hypothetical protein [Caudoviricetes sp.]
MISAGVIQDLSIKSAILVETVKLRYPKPRH